jgi:hypothetical protein
MLLLFFTPCFLMILLINNLKLSRDCLYYYSRKIYADNVNLLLEGNVKAFKSLNLTKDNIGVSCEATLASLLLYGLTIETNNSHSYLNHDEFSNEEMSNHRLLPINDEPLPSDIILVVNYVIRNHSLPPKAEILIKHLN